jgi:hypothetical protein
MANSLMEALRQSSTIPQPQASDLGQTSSIAQALTTKATGKALAPAAQPAISNIAEQASAQQAQSLQLGQTAQAATAQRELESQARAQEGEIDFAKREASEKQAQAQRALLTQSSRILDSYEQGQREIDYNKNAASMEQLGFNLRLSNSQYIDRLQREGRRNRLDNDLSFREALQRTIFDDEEDLFSSDLDFRRALRADDREFTERMASISLDDAINLANAQSRQANQQATWQGIGTILQGGIAGGKEAGDKSNE